MNCSSLTVFCAPLACVCCCLGVARACASGGERKLEEVEFPNSSDNSISGPWSALGFEYAVRRGADAVRTTS